MKFHSAIVFSVCLVLVVLTGFILAQQPTGPNIGKGKGSNPSGPSIGKSASEGGTIKAEQGRAIPPPRFKVVQVAPNKGYLALFTVPQAKAVITPLSVENEPSNPLPPGTADKDGLVNFPSLVPGKYRVEITCQDYEPFNDIVVIQKGRQTARIATLAWKFASLRIGLGKQASEDIVVKLDGQPFEKTKIEAGQLVFDQVPVGKHTFSFSKSGFSEWTQEFDIRPGNNFVSATMEAETILVTIKTQPGAEIYIDNDQKREAPETGKFQIGLPLGEHNLRLSLPGFESVRQVLNLAKEPRAITISLPLTPIAEDSEFSEFFETGTTNWWPSVPKEWKQETTREYGFRISGDSLALVKKTGKPGRRFNIYKDFDLLITFKMLNGKGAAWVVRAQQDNEGNYYLFELNRQARTLTLQVYQDGKSVRRESSPVVGNLDDLQAPYRIKLEIRGNRFQHKIFTEDSIPGKEPNFGGEFTDDAYGLGGVGLQAVNGIEMFVTEFVIENLRPGNTRTRSSK